MRRQKIIVSRNELEQTEDKCGQLQLLLVEKIGFGMVCVVKLVVSLYFGCMWPSQCNLTHIELFFILLFGLFGIMLFCSYT